MLDTDVPADLTSLSKAELKALQRQVQQALSKSEARRKKDALAAVEQAVKEFGFTLQEIMTFATEKGGKRTSRNRSGAEAKFRNPENLEETWSGRGRRPAWFKAQLEAGRSEEDLRA